MDVPWVQLVWDSYYFQRIPHDTILCGSFGWRDVCKLMDKFRAVTFVDVHSGDTVQFWSDYWQIGNSSVPLQDRFPRLYSFCLHKNLSVKEVFEASTFQDLF